MKIQTLEAKTAFDNVDYKISTIVSRSQFVDSSYVVNGHIPGPILQ